MLRWIRRLLALGTIGGGAWWLRSRRTSSSSEPTWPTISDAPPTRTYGGSAASGSSPSAADGVDGTPSATSAAPATATQRFAATDTLDAAAHSGNSDRSDNKVAASSASWALPVDGACPDGYPVKANNSSKIFHLPGGGSYERTIPERCYATAEAAEADGYRRAKR